MTNKKTFRPESSRIFLDTALAQALSKLPFQGEVKALNVGCGVEGRYHNLLADFTVEGVDIADPMGRTMPWHYHQCDASHLPFGDATFDLAVAIESFEHIDDNTAAMQEVSRTLKPGGWLVVTTPTRWTWIFEFGRHGPHYYDRKSLETLITRAGLEIQNFCACGGALFWLTNLIKSWLSPVGIRLLGKRWWPTIDAILSPLFHVSSLTDRILPFPATNWLVVAKKPEA
ncbi:MAG: class I SAM-dependent methyltransferase [Holosporaceae bacterium]|jgi:SAM-dependent methyltransferase